MRNAGKIVGFCAYEPQPDGRYRVMILDFQKATFFHQYTSAALKHIFDSTPAKAIYTWKPLDRERAQVYYRSGMVRNPFRKGPFSFRFPFIVYSQSYKIHNTDWDDIGNFDLQPFIQD